MPYNALFSERQKFKQWWIWLPILGIDLMILYVLFKQVFLNTPIGSNPMSNAGLVIVLAASILIGVLFFCFSLNTRISSEGVHVRFFPFHLKEKTYLWEEIDRAYVRTYQPIREYGGWGLRFGLGDKGNAFNVSGNKGLQLEFRNGKRLLIGTNDPEAIRQTLNTLGKA